MEGATLVLLSEHKLFLKGEPDIIHCGIHMNPVRGI